MNQELNIDHVAVYGTLKSGFWNNRLLSSSQLVNKTSIPGFRLYFRSSTSFPVAKWTNDKEDISVVEIYKLQDNETLNRLDRLESEGFMYDRGIVDVDGIKCWIYIGNPKYWGNLSKNELTERNDNGHFDWGFLDEKERRW